LTWYAKSSNKAEDSRRLLEEERQRIREADSQLIDEAIGIKPKKTKFVQQELDTVDVDYLFKKVTYVYLYMLKLWYFIYCTLLLGENN
jgi:hypothetical protein